MLQDFITILHQLLFIFNILFAVVIVFNERRNPAVTWAWLMVLSFLPYFGFIIYLILGMESRKHNVFHLKAKKDEEAFQKHLNLDFSGLSFLHNQEQLITSKQMLNIKDAEHFNDMVYLNYKAGLGAFTSNNTVELFHEGKTKFDRMLRDIQGAQRYIHLQYYIVRDDELGKQVISALADKAAQGVEVKLLIDGMGCMRTSKKLFKPLLRAGGEIAVFLPPHFVRINFRNHRKLCVIDGITGYIGGINIGDEYVSRVKRFGYWRDTHIRVIGDAVKQMEIRFIMDWNFIKKQNNRISFEEKYFPVIPPPKGNVAMQIVSSGPDTRWPNVHYGYAKMIFEADRSIYIQTPYFVPDDTIFKALRIAALSGIDVRIIIPAHPDHPFVYWASLSYLGELLDAGVRCYEYERGFIHSKLMVIDSSVSSIGTANMDVRSFDLNFEINSFIYDEKTSTEFQRKFNDDLRDCREILPEWYNHRSGLTKIKESISRLLSPLL